MKKFVALLLLIAVWLSACGSSAPVAPDASPTVVDQPLTATLPPASLSQSTANPTANAVPTAAPVSRKLHATNPATVKLASGKPQLVEFFAFW